MNTHYSVWSFVLLLAVLDIIYVHLYLFPYDFDKDDPKSDYNEGGFNPWMNVNDYERELRALPLYLSLIAMLIIAIVMLASETGQHYL